MDLRILGETRAVGIVARPSSVADQVIVRDTTIAGEGDYAIDVEYPPCDSYVWPTVTLDNVKIFGRWRKGLVRLRHAWNARLTNVMGAGLITNDTIAHPELLVGFDLGGSMDVHITNCFVTCAQVGVKSEDGEGINVSGGDYMHCLRPFHFIGDPTRRGRWGTPVATIHPTHALYLEHGVLASDYGGLSIAGDFYQSHLAGDAWGVYLARCEDAKVAARFWYNQPTKRGGAIVLADCKGTVISGVRVSDALSMGVIEFDDCAGTVLGANAWGGTLSYPTLAA